MADAPDPTTDLPNPLTRPRWVVPAVVGALFVATAASVATAWFDPAAVAARRNAQLAERGMVVWDAMVAYIGAHELDHPSGAALEAALSGPASPLPSRRLPPNPWSTTGAPIRIVHDHLPPVLPTPVQLQDDGRFADWTRVKAIVVGPGRMPDAGPPDARTYGVIVYRKDAIRAVMYGIGQDGDRARVVWTFNNMGGWAGRIGPLAAWSAGRLT